MDAHDVCVCFGPGTGHAAAVCKVLWVVSATQSCCPTLGKAVPIVGLLSLWNCFSGLPKMFSVNEYGRRMLCFRPVVLPWNLSWLCSSELMCEGKGYVIWLKWRIRRISGWITRGLHEGQDGERGESIGLHKLPSMQSHTGKEMTENLTIICVLGVGETPPPRGEPRQFLQVFVYVLFLSLSQVVLAKGKETQVCGFYEQ